VLWAANWAEIAMANKDYLVLIFSIVLYTTYIGDAIAWIIDDFMVFGDDAFIILMDFEEDVLFFLVKFEF
jgi:hypothetical protein